jgi:hypothetical protein
MFGADPNSELVRRQQHREAVLRSHQDLSAQNWASALRKAHTDAHLGVHDIRTRQVRWEGGKAVARVIAAFGLSALFFRTVLDNQTTETAVSVSFAMIATLLAWQARRTTELHNHIEVLTADNRFGAEIKVNWDKLLTNILGEQGLDLLFEAGEADPNWRSRLTVRLFGTWASENLRTIDEKGEHRLRGERGSGPYNLRIAGCVPFLPNNTYWNKPERVWGAQPVLLAAVESIGFVLYLDWHYRDSSARLSDKAMPFLAVPFEQFIPITIDINRQRQKSYYKHLFRDSEARKNIEAQAQFDDGSVFYWGERLDQWLDGLRGQERR